MFLKALVPRIWITENDAQVKVLCLKNMTATKDQVNTFLKSGR